MAVFGRVPASSEAGLRGLTTQDTPMPTAKISLKRLARASGSMAPEQLEAHIAASEKRKRDGESDGLLQGGSDQADAAIAESRPPVKLSSSQKKRDDESDGLLQGGSDQAGDGSSVESGGPTDLAPDDGMMTNEVDGARDVDDDARDADDTDRSPLPRAAAPPIGTSGGGGLPVPAGVRDDSGIGDGGCLAYALGKLDERLEEENGPTDLAPRRWHDDERGWWCS